MNKQKTTAQLGFLDKMFPGLILLCMAVGLILGKTTPQVGKMLEPLIPLGLFLMIYPTVAKVPFEALRKSALESRPALLSIILNYLINPLLLFFFGWIFLRSYPDLWTGLVLLGIAPCIGMVLVWADLGGADNALSVSLMAWNSLIQIVSVPVWIYLLIGTRVPLPAQLILESTFLYLGLPLVAAYATRRLVIRTKGEQWFKRHFTPVLGNIQLAALLTTLVVMFALKGEAILNEPELIAYMTLPLVLFFLTLFSIGTLSACFLAKLPMDKSVTVGFHVTGRNFELSIALALTAFAASPMIAVSTVIGPLIEVPVMLSLAWMGRRLVERFPLCCVPIRERIAV
ncbi:MAG: arsenic resistance protein [Anaerolineae bacterium]